MRDIMNSLHVVNALPPLATAHAATTPQVGPIIDTRGYDSLMFAIGTGTLADVDATFDVLIEDGDDSGLSDAAAVADEFLNGTEALAGFTFALDDGARKIGYVGPKRYARLTITPVANTGAAPMGAVAILGHAHLEKTPNPPA